MGEAPIRAITAEETRPIRQEVLRPHQRIDELAYHGDDAETTRHWGIHLDGELAAITSLFREPPPNSTETRAWRIRAVATRPAYRGRGCATQLLEHCLRYVAESGGGLLWCNARVSAESFYHRHGFETAGPPFLLPVIGPHVIMERRVSPAPPPR